ncbi:single-stranded DNA-binding protein [Nostocoides sp. F2B08]|uniref:single-stranded DNA-binding protein n=1 Tax=Nostocoides sp. F2B08 TaxID=2653936 RepID=UPI001262D2F3|nr:single-stranded DNA-binding protein [Tetrasphaera sp. F2B08]KAB7742995.1 single-stranded DNA-binding protein [Tetrasphaera sp. F2B08]
MRSDDEDPQQQRTRQRRGADAAHSPSDIGDGENTVVLVGRVSAAPEVRELPSGDALVTFRLVVPRPGRRRDAGATKRSATERTTVDVIDVACWTARTRRSALRLEAGDRARVEGSLRRRFFRAGGATASRYEVEATSVRASRPTGRSTGSGSELSSGVT